MEKHAADWKYVTYLVFDAPQRSAAGLTYEARVAWLEAHIQPQSETTYAAVVGVCKCTGRDHLSKLLKQVLIKGGEGIMLRQPKSLYEHARSHTLLVSGAGVCPLTRRTSPQEAADQFCKHFLISPSLPHQFGPAAGA